MKPIFSKLSISVLAITLETLALSAVWELSKARSGLKRKSFMILTLAALPKSFSNIPIP
jgi:hypothetical protein